MTYRDIEELQNLLDKDIRGVIAKGDISPQDYQCLDVAVDISKDLAEIAEKSFTLLRKMVDSVATEEEKNVTLKAKLILGGRFGVQPTEASF